MIMIPGNKCNICGRAAKRECEAMGAMVCPSCCGSKRGNHLDCSPDCASFPFSKRAYDLWLRIDSAWQPKAFQYTVQKIGEERFEQRALQLRPSFVDDEDHARMEGLGAAMIYFLCVPDREGGKSVGEIWAEEDWVGLNNDERFMAKYRILAMPAILEVQNVLDDTRTECTDLLDEERGQFVVFDRSTASRVNRFDTLLVWIVHYPHFTRVDGTGLYLKREQMDSFLEEIRKRVRGTRKGNSNLALKKYLAAHFEDAGEVIARLEREAHERMVASVDIQRCRAYYRIKTSMEDVEAVIKSKPDFEPAEDMDLQEGDPADSRYFVWFRRGEAKAIERRMPSIFRHKTPEDGVGTLGELRLSADELVLETLARKKFDFAKKLLQKYFGNDLAFLKEDITNLAQLALERSKDPDRVPPERPKSAIPPEMEKELIEKFYRRNYEKFLDDKVPMLNGRTPREASRDPQMRPLLISLMKLHLQQTGKQSRTQGLNINIEWVLKELRLDELM